ncbi:MAG: ankyrin repeat domain-containing protein [Candidatus Eremiobacteraeota bacterium]|nr:ankyrin repeat domain-containing protein [Candidatus Eremiobacteraeota bacterium]
MKTPLTFVIAAIILLTAMQPALAAGIAAAPGDLTARTYSAPEIFGAIKAGSLAKVKSIVEDNPGAITMREPKHGLTPLHIAVLMGQTKIASYLIGKNAPINAKDELLVTPLHIAAWNGNLEIVKLLEHHKAGINAETVFCWTPLHYADAYKQKDVAEFLEEKGGKKGEDKRIWENPITPRRIVQLKWKKEVWDVSLIDGKLTLEFPKSKNDKSYFIDNAVNYFKTAITADGPYVVYKTGSDVLYYHMSMKKSPKKGKVVRCDVVAAGVTAGKTGVNLYLVNPSHKLTKYWIDGSGVKVRWERHILYNESGFMN